MSAEQSQQQKKSLVEAKIAKKVSKVSEKKKVVEVEKKKVVEVKKKTMEEVLGEYAESLADDGIDEDTLKAFIAAAKKGQEKIKVEKQSQEDFEAAKKEFEAKSGMTGLQVELKTIQEKIKAIEESDEGKVFYKKRQRHAEGSEMRKVYDDRAATNKSNASKNLWCSRGSGVDGTCDEGQGGPKVIGCGYYCRSAKTLEKHAEKCKWKKDGKSFVKK
jgi:hypothetical protein